MSLEVKVGKKFWEAVTAEKLAVVVKQVGGAGYNITSGNKYILGSSTGGKSNTRLIVNPKVVFDELRENNILASAWETTKDEITPKAREQHSEEEKAAKEAEQEKKRIARAKKLQEQIAKQQQLLEKLQAGAAPTKKAAAKKTTKKK